MERELTEHEQRGIDPYVIDELKRRGLVLSVSDNAFIPFDPFVANDTSKLSKFPVAALPAKIRGYVVEVAECLQVPVDMAAVSALTVISLCVQGKYIVNPKPGWVEPLNLYTAIVARPSERKSPTSKEMTEIVHKYTKEENERRVPDIAEYKLKSEILTKRVSTLKDAAAKGKGKNKITMDEVLAVQNELNELEEVTPLQLVADDITPESLIRLMMENNERMAIISSEGGIFGLLAGRYSERTNLDIFLKAYSGDPVNVNRIGRKSDTLEHPALTMLLFVQPSIIQEIMENSEFKGRGFLARFLYSLPVSVIGSRSYDTMEVSEIEKKKYNDLVYSLLNIPDMFGCRVIRFSNEAHIKSREFFNEIEKRLIDDLEGIDSWAGKFHGQVMRIAGIIHCIKHELNSYNILLEEDTMKQSIEIGYYFLEHAKAAFSIMGLSEKQEIKNAKYILSRIDKRDNKDKRITKRDLFRLCDGRFKSVDEMKPGLDELVKRGYIMINTIKTGGRPSDIIEINPEYELQKVQTEGDEGV
ncbi:MAG: hypothetical protein K0S76_726 [Herbinix sp.]|nr:hypothetical protein [Herbinix sp.]